MKTTKPYKTYINLFFLLLFITNGIAQKFYVTKTGNKYHLQNCHYLKHSKKEITLQKAKNLGYLFCKICKRKTETTKKKQIQKTTSTKKNKQFITLVLNSTTKPQLSLFLTSLKPLLLT